MCFIYSKYINIKDRFMQNQPPVIMSLDATRLSNPKYKFWDTSIAGNQRSPNDLSLVTASQEHSQQKPQQATNRLNSRLDSLQSQVSDFVSNFSDDIDKSEHNQDNQKVRALNEEVESLRIRLQQSRVLNQNLVRELNKTTNQLRVSQSLNQQLNVQCDRLYQNVKTTHDKHSQLQNQKMQLMIQISKLNQQKQLAVNKAQILQEQVEYLNKKIETLHEDSSFEKSISADLKKQTLILKQQLNKMLVIMQDYSQLQQQVARTHLINTQIQQRVIKLQQQLKQTRVKVQQSQINQQRYMQEQNKLFLRLEQLQNQNKIIKERFSFVQQELLIKSSESMNQHSKQSEYERRYVKVLEQLTKRNEDLVFEILALSQRNHKLLDQRDFYMRRLQVNNINLQQNPRLNYRSNQRLPYDQFVSILKATDGEVQTLKRKLQLHQDQTSQHKLQTQQQQLNLQQKITQLSNLLQIREHQFRNREQILENEVQIHKKQYELMIKRNQEMKNNQVKLRLEIIDKDRIIMDFVEKRKLEGARAKGVGVGAG